MQLLIVGSGGREHVIAWKLALSEKVDKVYIAPGNGGTDTGKLSNVAIDTQDFHSLANFCRQKNIDYTLIGPEAPLASGIVDYFQQHNLPCFGPLKQAAQLESSKSFAKDFLHRHNIPTAHYVTFDKQADAEEYLQQQPDTPIVIKADGLAAGKGVVVAENIQQALSATADIFGGSMGQAGNRVVIEEYLQGDEASFIVMVDCQGNIVPMATSQDHKRLQDGDCGPNTGGMGAYSPAPVVTKALVQDIMHQIIRPTVEGMKADGNPYTGFLYAGLMIHQGKAKVIEFNCRFGDPEAQPILMRLEGDFALVCQQAIAGTLNKTSVNWSQKHALGVVLASEGYPTTHPTDEVIHGLESQMAEVEVFHSGTYKNSAGEYLTKGGRVLCVTALGTTLADAQATAYTRAETIGWKHCYKRTDIGYRALTK